MLTERQQETYDLVTEYKKKNPGASNLQTEKDLGIVYKTYKAALEKVEGMPSLRKKPGPKPGKRGSYKKRQEMITMPVAQSKNVVALVIPEGQVANILRELLGV